MWAIRAVALSLLLATEVAGAQPRPPPPEPVVTQQQSGPEPPASPHPWRRRPFSLDAVIGIATPWGLGGVSGEVAPIEPLSIGGGVGTNLLGLQLAAMARLRFTPAERSSFYVGAGYSQGRHHQSESNRDGVFSLLTGPLTAMGHDTERGRDWKTARWLDVELGLERREDRGLGVRGFVGSALLLNAGQGAPERPEDTQSPALPARALMLYAGAALGFSL